MFAIVGFMFCYRRIVVAGKMFFEAQCECVLSLSKILQVVIITCEFIHSAVIVFAVGFVGLHKYIVKLVSGSICNIKSLFVEDNG